MPCFVGFLSYRYGALGGSAGALEVGVVAGVACGATSGALEFDLTWSIFFFHCEKYF